MFDVGFSEILIIAVIALLVLGPERLPRATRMAGLWIRKARAQWYAVKDELERELAAEDMQRALKNPLADLKPEIDSLKNSVSGELRELENNFTELASAKPMSALRERLKNPLPELKAEFDTLLTPDKAAQGVAVTAAPNTSAEAEPGKPMTPL